MVNGRSEKSVNYCSSAYSIWTFKKTFHHFENLRILYIYTISFYIRTYKKNCTETIYNIFIPTFLLFLWGAICHKRSREDGGLCKCANGTPEKVLLISLQKHIPQIKLSGTAIVYAPPPPTDLVQWVSWLQLCLYIRWTRRGKGGGGREKSGGKFAYFFIYQRTF